MKKLGGKAIAIGAAVAMVVVALTVVLVMRGADERRLRKQLELGQKYLTEMNYDEAIACFLEALDIDPECMEAMLGLSESYAGKEMLDEADKVLGDAVNLLDKIENPGEEELIARSKIAEIQEMIRKKREELENAKADIEKEPEKESEKEVDKNSEEGEASKEGTSEEEPEALATASPDKENENPSPMSEPEADTPSDEPEEATPTEKPQEESGEANAPAGSGKYIDKPVVGDLPGVANGSGMWISCTVEDFEGVTYYHVHLKTMDGRDIAYVSYDHTPDWWNSPYVYITSFTSFGNGFTMVDFAGTSDKGVSGNLVKGVNLVE